MMLIYLPVAGETAQQQQRHRALAAVNLQWKLHLAFTHRVFAPQTARNRKKKLVSECERTCRSEDNRRLGLICMRVSVNHELWMDMVTATLRKRRRITGRCSSLCCRTVRSCAKVTQCRCVLGLFVCLFPKQFRCCRVRCLSLSLSVLD